jgi:hypothetical protein
MTAIRSNFIERIAQKPDWIHQIIRGISREKSIARNYHLARDTEIGSQ